MQRREEVNINVHRERGRMLSREMISDVEFSALLNRQAVPEMSTDKDNYYVLGSMGERWAGQGLNSLGCRAASIRMFLPVFWRAGCRTGRI